LKYQEIVVLDCYGHQVCTVHRIVVTPSVDVTGLIAQINLVVGDYFKSATTALDYTDMANELITWLRSKTLVLALIRQTQEESTGRPLAVICAVLTHWTAHYQAYRRLLMLHATLVAIVSVDATRMEANKKVITGDRKAKEHAHRMVGIIMNPIFWHAIARCCICILICTPLNNLHLSNLF